MPNFNFNLLIYYKFKVIFNYLVHPISNIYFFQVISIVFSSNIFQVILIVYLKFKVILKTKGLNTSKYTIIFSCCKNLKWN